MTRQIDAPRTALIRLHTHRCTTCGELLPTGLPCKACGGKSGTYVLPVIEQAILRAATPQPRDDLRDARNLGYREGRLAAWQELAEWADENETIADREVALTKGPLPTSDDVRAILSGAAPEPREPG